MQPTRLSLLCLAALALAACNPTVRGRCDLDEDCPEGTACELGICVAFSGPTDGGDPTNDGGNPDECVPACGSESICVDGACHSISQPFVAITSPVAGSAFPAQPLPVIIRVVAPGGVTKLQVELRASQAVVQLADAQPSDGERTYKAYLDLHDAAIVTGDYELVAVLTSGDVQLRSEPVAIRVGKSGPEIFIQPVAYPLRTDGHPSTGAFLRNETVVIEALVTDDFSGLSMNPPVLTIAGMAPVVGVQTGPRSFTFSFDGRAPPFKLLSGDVAFEISATNAANLETKVQGSFRLSRWKWTWSKQRNGPIRTAPALARGLIFLGSDDNYVYAIRPDTGTQAWDFNASSPVLGHITAGDSRIYAATKEGRIYALDPVDAPISDTQRRIFRCPDATGGFGQPPLREFRAGAALTRTVRSNSDSTTEETLVVYTSDGHLRFIRQNAFPQPFGQPNGCVWEGAGGTWPTFNSNDAVVPTLVPNGTDNVIFLADMAGVVRRVTVKLASGGTGQQPTFQLNQDWSKNIGGAIHGSLPYGTIAGAPGVLAMREDSRTYGFSAGGAELWTSGPRVLPGQSRVPTSLTNSFGFAVDMNGNLAGLRLNDGQAAGTPVPLSAVSTNEANAGAITASDGRVYYASGTKLQSVALGGVIEWVFEPTPAGTDLTYLDLGTPALGCDGTLYVTASNSKKGYVHAIITDSTGGMAEGPWTRPFHDSRNTSNAAAPLSTSAACTD
jgi:outer membrane protein assembly factor BamB